MEAKKKTIMQAIVCVGLVCLIWGGYFLVKTYHTNRILDIKKDDFSWVYQVDSVKTNGKDFVLQGFAFELDKDAEEGAFEIVLQDIESGKNYFPEMEYKKRADVNEYFLCEYDYLQSGFEATIRTKKLDLEEKYYEVLLRVTGKKQAYHTGTYISNGKLMYVNPIEYRMLDVRGTNLEKVVENGVLRVYNPEKHMYVYQYEGELYWISEKDYVEGDTYIQYEVYTTQIKRLLQELDQNRSWRSIGFSFVSNEVCELRTGQYKVAKSEIPCNYSVTKIWTGYSLNKWSLDVCFRPWYEFMQK